MTNCSGIKLTSAIALLAVIAAAAPYKESEAVNQANLPYNVGLVEAGYKNNYATENVEPSYEAPYDNGSGGYNGEVEPSHEYPEPPHTYEAVEPSETSKCESVEPTTVTEVEVTTATVTEYVTATVTETETCTETVTQPAPPAVTVTSIVTVTSTVTQEVAPTSEAKPYYPTAYAEAPHPTYVVAPSSYETHEPEHSVAPSAYENAPAHTYAATAPVYAPEPAAYPGAAKKSYDKPHKHDKYSNSHLASNPWVKPVEAQWNHPQGQQDVGFHVKN
ncbi:hypothetical protein H4R24_003772 [Coemansia sp. RSA 988]|nr:hypothetical protein H4R24_003772 [Coemansia sp. RSA 988]